MAIVHSEAAVLERAVPGPALYSVSTFPKQHVRAVVGLLHGYADHAARYEHVADLWAEEGVGTVALDMRGHGRAMGRRGYCRRFDEYLDDASELARLVRVRANGAPCFLFGHSFGGLVAAASVLETPRFWRGMILSGPYFGLALEVPQAKVVAGKIASKLLPVLALPSGLGGEQMTHDPVRAKAYDDDPLSFKVATARWFTETDKAQERVLARASTIRLPLLLTFGGEDTIAKIASARVFFARAGSKDKTWDERAGLRHEPLSEPEWPDVAGMMAKWILKQAQNVS